MQLVESVRFKIPCILFSVKTYAQNTVPQQDSTNEAILIKRGIVKDTAYENYASGEFTPGKGFDLASLVMLVGGLFLIYKSVKEIHGKLEGEDHV